MPTKNNYSTMKNMRWEYSLLEQIDEHKDELIPFAAWVKQACREKLEREGYRPKSDEQKQLDDIRPPRKKQESRYKWHTPKGTFENCQKAADALGVNRRTLSDWFNSPDNKDYWKEKVK